MKPSAFSTRSSPQNRKAPVWDFPSGGESSSRMAAVCRRVPTPDGVRSYSSHCPASDSRLAVGSLTRWRQKSVVHKAASFRHAVGIVGCPPLKRLKARHDRPSASMRERPEPQLLLADRPKSRQTVRLDDQEEDDQRAEDHRLQIGHEIDRNIGPGEARRVVEKIGGGSTMKAAPRKEPRMLPRPPMMVMNKIWNDRSISNALASTELV